MRETVAWLLPACLLVIVAIHQIVLTRTAMLDPWKGGGFGMFSTDAGTTSRHLHVFVIRLEGGTAIETEIEIPEDLDDDEYALRVLPTRDRFDAFSRRLSEAIREPHPDHSGLRIEFYEIETDRVDLVPEATLVHTHHHEVER